MSKTRIGTFRPPSADDPALPEVVRRLVEVDRIRQRNYRLDVDGGLRYRRAAAQASGVSPASR